MDLDKAIKRSAEDSSGTFSRATTPKVEQGSERYESFIEALDIAGVLPSDWLKVNMFDYEGRDDALVNFYVKDPTQDPLDAVTRSNIVAFRVTDDGKTLKVSKC